MSLIALGVTGGIGAYKAVEVVRGLQKQGHDVAAIMTRSARRFVGEVTFEAITRRPVITDQFARGTNADIEHIALATDIALLLVAPATANVIGKFATGIADDFLTSLYLATRAPVLMAPAMNTNMLEHEAVRRNLATLTARGVQMVDPGQGYLACGWIGKGRLAEPADIVDAALRILQPGGSLLGRLVVVSAGPTYEDLDRVRYIGNRSSGRMGYALAIEAGRRGARVILVSGPTHLAAPAGVELVSVRSAAEMHAAMLQHSADADIVVMSAAVADYTPRAAVDGKIEKSDGPLELTLVRTPDILADLGRARDDRARPVLIGFAAESGDPVPRAREKLRRKRVDLIVANDITRPDAGFNVDTNAVTLVSADGDDVLPLAAKSDVAARILDRAEAILAASATDGTDKERGTRTGRMTRTSTDKS
jgi:phosphopantothenoylcysteine decarboxylase / phosphopantothenate---cysteine ligase